MGPKYDGIASDLLTCPDDLDGYFGHFVKGIHFRLCWLCDDPFLVWLA